MAIRCFRRWSADRDPRELLDPANHVSTPWGESDHVACDKCAGTGQAPHECRSCLERGAEPGCPACEGRVRWVQTCPTCEGTGRIDRTERRGVSVFPTHAGLLRYLVEQDAELDGNVILELEGEPTGDIDIDADSGAMLVRPVHVVGAHPIDPELVEAVRRRLG